MPNTTDAAARSFLLRCWQERRAQPEQPSVRRFLLQDVSDAQYQRAFASFEQLVVFLRQELLEEKVIPGTD